MSQAFPEDVLHRVPTSRWRHIITFPSMHRRYYRRVIECRDGLVRISPYLPQAEAAGSELVTTAVRAQQLQAALRARAHQFPPAGGPMAFASPRDPDLDADVAELLALSRALNHPATTLSARSRSREVTLRESITAGELAGPRILAATAPLTPPRGHCWFLGGMTPGGAPMWQRLQYRGGAHGRRGGPPARASGGCARSWHQQYPGVCRGRCRHHRALHLAERTRRRRT